MPDFKQLHAEIWFEPPHDKTTKWCAPRKDTDQPGHPPSLHNQSSLKKAWSFATDWAYSEDSDPTGWTPRLIWVLARCTVILLVLGSDQTGWMPRLTESLLGAQSFCWFLIVNILLSSILDYPSSIKLKCTSWQVNWKDHIDMVRGGKTHCTPTGNIVQFLNAL